MILFADNLRTTSGALIQVVVGPGLFGPGVCLDANDVYLTPGNELNVIRAHSIRMRKRHACGSGFGIQSHRSSTSRGVLKSGQRLSAMRRVRLANL